MKRILILLAKLLAAVGIARHRFHVDAGTQVRIRATLVGPGGVPVPQANVALERPPEGRERAPNRQSVGQTDAAGQIDATVFWRWSYRTPRLDMPPPAPATFVVFTRPGSPDVRAPISLTTAATSASVVQIDLGQVRMT